ncbi:MAG: DUF2252 family protein [Gemmatimonadaceae bacterium]
MNIHDAVADYERWLGGRLPLVAADLDIKHRRMRQGAFPFLRATYFRWAQRWPATCADLLDAPVVLAVGDLHVENFGTWRDAEGRLVWGINDFDEVWRLPYTNDLVRLAASVALAADASELRLDIKDAMASLLSGYRESLAVGGQPVVLAERHHALRQMAVSRLRDPEEFWKKLDAAAPLRGALPREARSALARLWPSRALPWRVAHRVAGVGSLGRQRFVAMAEWRGGRIAREAKGLAVSAAAWASGSRRVGRTLYATAIDRAVRCADPFVTVHEGWIARRLAPDCSRIELASLPRNRDERHLLHAMGWETANVHLGSASARALLADLERRPKNWLVRAAAAMRTVVRDDWAEWRAGPASARRRPASRP